MIYNIAKLDLVRIVFLPYPTNITSVFSLCLIVLCSRYQQQHGRSLQAEGTAPGRCSPQEEVEGQDEAGLQDKVYSLLSNMVFSNFILLQGS